MNVEVYGPSRTFASWKDAGEWRWFALKIAPGREFAAERILREDGFDVFVPLKHLSGRFRKGTPRPISARPRFAGYVFVGFNTDAIPWGDIFRFRMILGVISQNDRPASLPGADMWGLVIGSSRVVRYTNKQDAKKRRQRKGDAAKIISGPYQGRAIRYIEIGTDLGRREADLFELFEPYLAKSDGV